MFRHRLESFFWMLRFRFRFFLKRKNSKRSVALVVNSFDKGGLEQVVLNLYLGYKKQGWNVYILSQTRNVGQMAEKLIDIRDIYIFDNNKDAFISFCWRKKIDVLHYHYNTYMMPGARKMGFLILYTMHNVYTWMSLDEIQLYSKKLSFAHKIVPVSGFVEKYYLARTGVSKSNIHTILNGVDFEELDRKYDNFPISRESLGLKATDKVVSVIASFHHVKHQIGMIGVMEQIYKTNPNIKLLLVGNKGDINYYNAFEKELADSVAQENIIVVPYFDHIYMGQFLREIVDIFALPTLQEGCSNAVLEAIYCAKPMLLTNVGNAGDIKDTTSCEIVSAAYEDIVTLSQADVLTISMQKSNKNTKELSDAIIKITSNLDKYTAKAVKVAKSTAVYSTEYMVEQYVKIIESLR